MRAGWSVTDGLPTFARGRFVIRLFVGDGAAIGRMKVYSDVGEMSSAFGTGTVRMITMSGERLRALRGTDTAVGVHVLNRREELLGGSGIEWATLDKGLELARQADARSLAAASDYRRLCSRHSQVTHV